MGSLKGEFYVQHPQSFVVNGKEDKVYLLNKKLYGLKQASRIWYNQINSYFIQHGYERSKNEPLYMWRNKVRVMFLLLYYILMI
jgi:hypothetical protein